MLPANPWPRRVFVALIVAALVLVILTMFWSDPLRYGLAAIAAAVLARVYDPNRVG